MTEPKAPLRLDDQLAKVLSHRQSRNQLRRLTTVPPGTVDFSSNGYLSLSSHPATQEAFLARLKQAYASQDQDANIVLGSGGSRLLDGNSVSAESLERRIAAFHRAPDGLLFNSAMEANVGLFACVPGSGDAVVYDELVHASVHDGMRLSRVSPSRRVPFAHNRIFAGEDEEMGQIESGPAVKSLEATLISLCRNDTIEGRETEAGDRNVFVAVEGVYSMDGDVGRLADVVACVERCLPRGNGHVVVDEAHSTGLFGERGKGLVCELGLEERVWARVHGFGKAMGCAGGIVLCSATTRSYLINYARTLIYTTFMPLQLLTSIAVAYDFLMDGHAESLKARLKSLAQLTHASLLSICRRHQPPPALLRVNTEKPETPIIPIFTSRPRDLASHCQERGFMIRPIVAPTVPRGMERVRVCLHASNTEGEVRALCAAVEGWTLRLRNVDQNAEESASAGEMAGAQSKSKL